MLGIHNSILYKYLLSLMFDFKTYYFALDEYKLLRNVSIIPQDKLKIVLDNAISHKLEDIEKFIRAKHGNGNIEEILSGFHIPEKEQLIRYIARLSMSF